MNPNRPSILTLSESAKRAFIAFYDANAEEREKMESSAQKSFWPKLTGYAARIALVFHVVRYIDGDTTDYHTVDGETMMSAIHVAQWFKRESLRIIEAMRGEVEFVDFEATTIKAILRKKGKCSAREIVQTCRRFRGKGGTEQVEKKLREMVAAGALMSEFEPGKSGPGKTLYCLPPVYGSTGNATENEEPVDVDIVDGGENEPFDFTDENEPFNFTDVPEFPVELDNILPDYDESDELDWDFLG